MLDFEHTASEENRSDLLGMTALYLSPKNKLNFLFEIILVGCIIYLSYIIYSLKKNKLNVESLTHENENLKIQINQKQNEFLSREKNLSQTIQNLQLSFNKEQDLIKERKLELDLKEKNLLKNLSSLEEKLQQETETRKKVVSQKKSGEVRLGHIAETLAPFLNQFNFDPENCTFLGKPIDYISFGDDEITFIEVKSGNSQLNKKQRFIRDQVKAKLVSWKEVRIK
jgi:predicted Holliday junction resolvase-like endonuclease